MLNHVIMALVTLLFTCAILKMDLLPPLSQDLHQSQSIALYYSPKCPHSQKVLAFLKKENIQIDLKDVTQDPQAKAVLREVGGYLIVPCLIVNGRAIYNDDDIIQWLKEKFKKRDI